MEIVLAHAADVSNPSGGTERVSAFASGLDAAGHDVTLVVPEPSGSLPERISTIRTVTVPINGSGVLTQPLRGATIIRRAKRESEGRDTALQIEHSTLAGLASTFSCRDYVLDMHDLAFPSPIYGDLPFSSGVQRMIMYLEGRGLRAASEVIVVSDQMKALIDETWNMATDRFTTIPNGYFSDVRESYISPESVTGRVAFLGSLHPKLSVKTFTEICRLSEVSELLVVGDGAMRSELESIDEAKLRLTGYLPDDQAFELVSRAQVAINPQCVSRLQRASSPVKLYYYLALGLPMVLTKGPDEVRTLVAEGAAISVPEGGNFAEAVRQVLADDERRKSMRAAAKALGQEFTWDARIEQLVELYDEIDR